jgi:SAM-dependent methyltransferase
LTASAGQFAPDFLGPRHRLRESLLLKLFLDAEPGQHVLNAGAGQGSFSTLLEAQDFAVTSVDSSPDALSRLRARTKGAVVDADVTDLPFADDSFDAAVLGEVLEHVPDDARAMREVIRVTRAGGVVAISVPRNPAYFGPSDVWAGHVRRYTRTGLISLVEAAGLEVERCVPWGFPFSSVYHRRLYEPRLRRSGPRPVGAAGGIALRVLGVLLQADRLFVGVEPGALGLLLRGRSLERSDALPDVRRVVSSP